MNRRSVLLLLATLVAVIGTAMVALYVRSADSRAQEKFDTVEVLTATQLIEPGESIEAVTAAGKVALTPVPQNQKLDGALQNTESLTGKVATTAIYPGEQIIAAKFGGAAEGPTLAIPKGMQAISVELTDPGRVAGFVTPGSEVSIYHLQGRADGLTGGTSGEKPSQAALDGQQGHVVLLLERVLVLGVGSTSTTTTTKTVGPDGQATTEEVPKTLLTIAVSQEDAEKVLFAATDEDEHGGIAFALLTKDSKTRYTRGTGWENLYYY